MLCLFVCFIVVCLFRYIPTCLVNDYLGHQGGKKSKLTQQVMVSILHIFMVHNYFSGLGLFTSFFIIFSRVTQQTELPKMETLTYQSVLQNHELLGKEITKFL